MLYGKDFLILLQNGLQIPLILGTNSNTEVMLTVRLLLQRLLMLMLIYSVAHGLTDVVLNADCDRF